MLHWVAQFLLMLMTSLPSHQTLEPRLNCQLIKTSTYYYTYSSKTPLYCCFFILNITKTAVPTQTIRINKRIPTTDIPVYKHIIKNSENIYTQCNCSSIPAITTVGRGGAWHTVPGGEIVGDILVGTTEWRWDGYKELVHVMKTYLLVGESSDVMSDTSPSKMDCSLSQEYTTT